MFLYSRPDCSPIDLFNALQLGIVCTYSRTELKSQPNRADSDELALLWHSQIHDSSPVVSLPSHPLLRAPAVRYARRRLGTSQIRHFNYVCPAFVTECLVSGKKSRATFSTSQKRNENPFVFVSSVDWFIRLSTYAVFYLFHIRLIYWLCTICLMDSGWTPGSLKKVQQKQRLCGNSFSTIAMIVKWERSLRRSSVLRRMVSVQSIRSLKIKHSFTWGNMWLIHTEWENGKEI